MYAEWTLSCGWREWGGPERKTPFFILKDLDRPEGFVELQGGIESTVSKIKWVEGKGGVMDGEYRNLANALILYLTPDGTQDRETTEKASNI